MTNKLNKMNGPLLTSSYARQMAKVVLLEEVSVSRSLYY